MGLCHAGCRLRIVIELTLAVFFSTSAFAQTAVPAQGTLEDEVETVKAENATLREQIRKIEEEQAALREAIRPSQPASAAAVPPPSVPAKQAGDERYQEGIILAQSADNAKVPFLVRLNNNTQIRYLNTLS